MHEMREKLTIEVKFSRWTVEDAGPYIPKNKNA